MNISKIQKKVCAKFGDTIKVIYDNDCLLLKGKLTNWQAKVDAGLFVAKLNNNKTIHVVNDIEVTEATNTPMILPKILDASLDGRTPDVLIIGAGIVGCAIARELTKEKLDILLVEKEYDVALHASSRNDGMIHPGIDIKPGLLKKKFNNLGNKMYPKLCRELGVDFQRTGQYLCFKSHWYMPLLLLTIPYFNLTLAGKAHLYSGKKLRKMEPDISNEAKCAMFFDGAGIVCPYNLTIAYAENAVDNGAKLSLNTAVTSMNVFNGHIESVATNKGIIYPKVVINAAGVFTEDIAMMAKDRFFSIHPRKGTNAILDKKTRKHIFTIYSLIGTQSKSSHTKGGGIVGTVDGNVLVGPDAVETPDKENFATKASSVTATFAKQKHAGDWLDTRDIITCFTGIRAATYEEDFIIEKGHKTHNIIHAAGIQSPGLTSAPAIALKIEELTLALLKNPEKNNNFNPIRKPIVKASLLSLEDRNALIKQNPNYGEIYCRCEEISKGEILDSLHRSVPCVTVDGVKRRVRPGMGRCQGGFCGPLVLKLIAQEFNIPLNEVKKGYENSQILFGEKGVRNEQL